MPYPHDSKSASRITSHNVHSHQQPLNVDIHFLPFTFNEEMCVISPPNPIPPVKHVSNESQT
ncbi:unnamed protein product, partial [Rotaria magnacalcarata]